MVQHLLDDYEFLYMLPKSNMYGKVGLGLGKDITNVSILNRTCICKSCHCSKRDFESMFISFENERNEFILGWIYRHRNGNMKHFADDLERTLMTINGTAVLTWIVNIRNIKQKAVLRNCLKVAEQSYYYCQLVDGTKQSAYNSWKDLGQVINRNKKKRWRTINKMCLMANMLLSIRISLIVWICIFVKLLKSSRMFSRTQAMAIKDTYWLESKTHFSYHLPKIMNY